MVYQGYGGGLDVATLWEVGRVATGGLMPDLTIVLDVPPEVAAARMARPLDRMEKQGAAFHARVREGFLAEAARAPDKIVVVERRRLDRGSASGDSEKSVRQSAVAKPQAVCSRQSLIPHLILHHFLPCPGTASTDTTTWSSSFAGRSARGRLASSFLFAGPAGIGKRTFALKLAQAMLCQTRPEEALDPCGTCPSCAQVAAGTHPDLDVVAKPDDKSFIPLELLIGEREHRRREGLCHNIGLKPFLGGRKIAVIDDADYLNAEGANALLKTLEEPPPRSVLILIGTTPAKQLPTIRSRCQLIRFRPLPIDGRRRVAGVEGLGGRSGRSPAACPVQRREPSTGVGAGRSRSVVVSQHALRAAFRADARQRATCPDGRGVCRRGRQGSLGPAGPASASRRLRRRVLPATAARPMRRFRVGGRGAAEPRRPGDRARS